MIYEIDLVEDTNEENEINEEFIKVKNLFLESFLGEDSFSVLSTGDLLSPDFNEDLLGDIDAYLEKVVSKCVDVLKNVEEGTNDYVRGEIDFGLPLSFKSILSDTVIGNTYIKKDFLESIQKYLEFYKEMGMVEMYSKDYLEDKVLKPLVNDVYFKKFLKHIKDSESTYSHKIIKGIVGVREYEYDNEDKEEGNLEERAYEEVSNNLLINYLNIILSGYEAILIKDRFYLIKTVKES